MHILLTNDDGIQAKGIRTLASHLRKAGYDITIVAPAQERSAASHSLTLRRPVRAEKIAEQEYAIEGTPVDCMVIAVQKLLNKPVNLVISGINAGQNMGEDIHYSGTVAAAKEAAFFGYKAIAISINSYKDQIFETAAEWMVLMLKSGLADILQKNQVLNINVPNIRFDEVKGIRLTTTGHRKYYNFIKLIEEDDKGFSYIIGGDLPVWDKQKGTDAEAIAENYISLTPLGFEMTKGDAFPVLLEWIEENETRLRP
ncbi:MAG: 5'/3'-nucleotidase SurE [Candidatus Cloacimonadaceae bacterium]